MDEFHELQPTFFLMATDEFSRLVMAIECCGEKCTGKFCPHCGKKVRTNSLDSLVAYCCSRQVAAEKRAAKGDDGAATAARQAQQWKTWATELQAVLDAAPVSEATCPN